MTTSIRDFVLVALGLALPAAAKAQGPSDVARKEARAFKIAPGTSAPHLDGRLDDSIWARTPFLSDLTAKEPVEGAAPRAATRIALAYDDDALYVAARMQSEHPGDVPMVVTRRDTWGISEVVFIAFDTYLDRRTAYTFGVTSAGTRVDYYQPTDDELSRDFGYDPVWEAHVSVDSTGWSAEMRIPFSQLRFTDRPEQVWGLNVNRYIPRRNESLFWVMIPKNENGWSSRFGNLVGIGGIHPSRRLELVPYGATNATITGARNPANPFDDGRNLVARGGADLKMGLGPSLTLDATVNPDFGQVEADPAEVNLSAFPTFFAEKRPFFAEGSDLLQMAGFFYSRRVGAPPHGDASGSFLARPQNSTILGATKLTGRLSPSLSIAALGAVTDREYAQTYDLVTAARGRVRIEPVTGYGAARIVKKFGPAGSTAGFMLTGVQRSLSSSDPLREILTRNATSGGSNGVLRFSGGKYEARWMAGFSRVEGDTAALRRIQQASAHFLQSPDLRSGGYDPKRTTLTGYTFSYRVEKLGGRHWLGDVWGEVESPTFEINDLGRLNSGSDIDNYIDLKYRETRPRGRIYNYNFGVSAKAGFNFDGVRQFSQASFTSTFTWRNYLQTYGSFFQDFAATSDALTRGGPLMATPRNWRLLLGFQTNDRRNTNVYGSADYRNDELGGWGYTFNGGVTTRAGGQWSLSITPRYLRSRDPRQYLSTQAGGAPATYGQRYIFSFIDRSTLAAQLRLSYLLKPDLTLELYAEPFSASGRYSRFGELAAARSQALKVYGTNGTTLARGADGSVQITDGASSFSLPNPDFNVVSFRSNLVLRWEWRAGSTMYLVWQQNRAGSRTVGDLVGPVRLWDSFTARGDNFLAFKLAYWLPVL
jgi:hypothetical protein